MRMAYTQLSHRGSCILASKKSWSSGDCWVGYKSSLATHMDTNDPVHIKSPSHRPRTAHDAHSLLSIRSFALSKGVATLALFRPCISAGVVNQDEQACSQRGCQSDTGEWPRTEHLTMNPTEVQRLFSNRLENRSIFPTSLTQNQKDSSRKTHRQQQHAASLYISPRPSAVRSSATPNDSPHRPPKHPPQQRTHTNLQTPRKAKRLRRSIARPASRARTTSWTAQRVREMVAAAANQIGVDVRKRRGAVARSNCPFSAQIRLSEKYSDDNGHHSVPPVHGASGVGKRWRRRRRRRRLALQRPQRRLYARV